MILFFGLFVEGREWFFKKLKVSWVDSIWGNIGFKKIQMEYMK